MSKTRQGGFVAAVGSVLLLAGLPAILAAAEPSGVTQSPDQPPTPPGLWTEQRMRDAKPIMPLVPPDALPSQPEAGRHPPDGMPGAAAGSSGE